MKNLEKNSDLNKEEEEEEYCSDGCGDCCCGCPDDKEQTEVKKEEESNPDLILAKQEIKELLKENKNLKEQQKSFQDDLNKKFLELMEKKSQEASVILQNKQKEIEKRITDEFENKKNYLYEKQFSELVELISQFQKIVFSPIQDEKIKNYLIGFQMYVNKFKNLLSDLEIVEIVPQINEEFNSEYMTSVKTEKVDNVDQKNKILEVYSPAYKLHNRIIKLSEVKVSI